MNTVVSSFFGGCVCLATLAVSAVNLPSPQGAGTDPESLTGAWRVDLPSRTEISLNGLWRARPVAADEATEVVPPDGDWGWGKIPGVLCREGVGHRMDDMPVLFGGKFAGKGAAPSDANERMWYRRTFEMPREAEGRRVGVRFARVNTRAVVYVDGQLAGEVSWPEGELDITRFAKPGSRQTLAVFVTAYMPDWEPSETLTFMGGPGMTFKNKGKRKLHWRGITGDVTLVLAPKGARATFAWGELHDGKVRFIVETAGLDSSRGCTAKVKATPLWKDGASAREFSASGLKPDAAGRVSFDSEWPDLALWDLDTPQHRYRVETELFAEDGSRIDEVPPYDTGFREVKLVGREVFMNGRPLHLTTLLGPASVPSALDRTAALVFCRRAKAMMFSSFNFNTAFVPGAPDYDEFPSAADETGIAMMCASIPDITNAPLDKDTLWKDEKMQAIWRERAEISVRAVRRHPSVVLYKMNMNKTGHRDDVHPHVAATGEVDPEDDARPTRKSALWSMKEMGKVDPTRPAYSHDSGNLGDFYTKNIYLGWLPPQERADFLEEWSRIGRHPVNFVEYGTPDSSRFQSFHRPYFIYRTPCYQKSWVAEHSAEWFGEGAVRGGEAVRSLYKNEERLMQESPMVYQFGGMRGEIDKQTSEKSEVMGRFWAETLRGMRGWGCHGVLPWVQNFMFKMPKAKREENPDRWRLAKGRGVVPDFRTSTYRGGMYSSISLGERIYAEDGVFATTAYGDAQRRWARPAIGFIGGESVFTEKRRNYLVGEKLAKRLVLINDHSAAVVAKWKWRALNGGKVLASGEGETKVAPGGRSDAVFSFEPAVSGPWTIEAEFAFSDGDRQTDSFDVHVLPPPEKAKNGAIALYDPKGLTEAEFKRLGIAHAETIRSPEEFRKELGALPMGTAVVIGREALTSDLWDDVVVPECEAGRRFLIFEQTKKCLESLGFRVQERGVRTAFRRSAALDEMLKGPCGCGLSADALLCDWAGESTLASADLSGNRRDRLGRVTQDWAGLRMTRIIRVNNRGCVATVLPEKPQTSDWLPLVDCAFALEYSPLMRFRTGGGMVLLCQMDVTARTVADPAADELLRGLAASLSAPMPKRWSVPDFLGRDAVRAGFAWGVKSWETGKDLVVSPGAKMPEDLHKSIEEGATVLCLGMSADEIRAWSPVPVNVAMTNGCTFARIEKPGPELDGLSNCDFLWHGAPSFAAFMDEDPAGNPSYKCIRYGKGKIVFWQLPPWKFNADESHLRSTRRAASRMFARLMCNLGWSTFTNGTGYHCRPMYKDVPEGADDPYEWVNL